MDIFGSCSGDAKDRRFFFRLVRMTNSAVAECSLHLVDSFCTLMPFLLAALSSQFQNVRTAHPKTHAFFKRPPEVALRGSLQVEKFETIFHTQFGGPAKIDVSCLIFKCLKVTPRFPFGPKPILGVAYATLTPIFALLRPFLAISISLKNDQIVQI